MRELELLGDYLHQLRRERLELAHSAALGSDGTLEQIRIYAHEAELCTRIREAVKVLANDPGKFIEEFIT